MTALRQLPIVLTIVLGTLASAGLLLLSASWERRIETIDFENTAKDHVTIINGDLQDAGAVIETVRALFEASDHPVTRAEFMRFSKALHSRTAGLRDLGWAPRITDAGRDAFEQALRSSGYPAFEILERGPSGALQRASRHPEYFPVLFLDSGSTVQPVLGFDLATEPNRYDAIERATLARRTAATPPIRLLTVPRDRGGMMGFAAAGPQTGNPGSSVDGVVFGAFDNAAMIDGIIAAKRPLAGIDLYLFDPAGPPGARLIHWRPSPANSTATPRPAPSESVLRNQIHWEGTLSMLDQKWGVIFAPDPTVAARAWSWRALLAPAAGLLLTGIIAVYLLNAQRRTLQLEQLTSTLRETTAGLYHQAEKITHMAHHDTLTGLSNRRMFSEQLRKAVTPAECGHDGHDAERCAILLMDLDRFKPVNDLHGHAVGDAVLCEVAARLRAAALPGETVARLGGDEFAAIVQGTDAANASANLARRIVLAMAQPIHLGTLALDVGITIGIARSPDDATDPALLMRAADLAMYRAKRQQRGTVRYYEPFMDEELRTLGTLKPSRPTTVGWV